MGFVNLRLATTALLDQPECSFASVSGRAGSRQAAQPGSGCSQRAATMLHVGALKRRSTATRGHVFRLLAVSSWCSSDTSAHCAQEISHAMGPQPGRPSIPPMCCRLTR